MKAWEISGFDGANKNGAIGKSATQAYLGATNLQQAGLARLQHAKLATIHHAKLGKARNQTRTASHLGDLSPFSGLQQIQRNIHGLDQLRPC